MPTLVSRVILIGLRWGLAIWIVASSLGDSSVPPRLKIADLNQLREMR